MFAKLLKGFGILTIVIVFLFGAGEVWVYRNKDEIFRKAKEAVNENLNGELTIGDIKFRPFAGGYGLNFTLYDVQLVDTLYKSHNTPILMAERIHVAVDLNSIFKGKITVKNLTLQNGGLRVFVRKDGYSNLSIFANQKKKEKKGGKDNLNAWINRFGKTRFTSFEATYYDSTSDKQYGAIFIDAENQISKKDTAIAITFGGRIFFKGLVFKPEKGGFLTNQETRLNLNISYNPDRRLLRILPSTLHTVKNDEIGIRGKVDLADSVKRYELGFNSKGIEVSHALPLLQKFLSEKIDSLKIQTKVAIDVRLKGSSKPGRPRAELEFKTAPFTFVLPVGELKKVQLSAKFTNQADTTKPPGPLNARMSSVDTKGMFESLPFQMKFAVSNFENPRALVDGQIRADSINLDGVLDPKRYKFKKGTAQIDFHFDGSLKKFYVPEKDDLDGNLYGKVSVQNIAIDYLPRGVHLKDINGDFVFNQKALVFPSFSFDDGMNKLYIKGRVLDLIPFLFGSPRPLRALVDINIPTWKLNWLETLLASKTPVRSKKRKSLKLSDLLDDVIDNMSIAAQLRSKHLIYKSFNGRNVKGDFVVTNNSMRIKSFGMEAFDKGYFEVSGELDNSGTKLLPQASFRGKVVNASVHSVLSSFNNFGQKTVTDKNIKGILNTSFNFESRLTNDVKLVPSSMRGDLKVDLRDGYILNFEPFLKMKKLIFKKRNFEKVQLAPIETEFILKGQEIEIKPLEIESNVMTLYIDGVYSFGSKTNINIQIPLSNLKKRDSTYVLVPHDESRKNGANVFLRAVDEGGEVNIKLAFRKKEKKEK